MEKKIFIRIGLVLLLAISAIILFSSSKSITRSATKDCKESMQNCCKQEKDSDTNGGIDFENLPGKFFSSISY
ncbi:MAG: hypothetical protein WDO19_30995 [Bacteroidota bacterium]